MEDGVEKPLAGKLIALCVTGSIACVETVKLCHALRRRGAEVQAVMSSAACGIIHPDALTYATNRDTITTISGLVEHVTYCGDEGVADLVLIAPATANTIAKIACGIDDTPPTTFVTTALGNTREKMPIIIVPAMHEAMFRHPAIPAHLSQLTEWGITVIEPRIEEGKAKIADIDTIVLACERACSTQTLAGTSVLITGGRCEEPVDDIRILTTRSSGTMGIELACAAYRSGAHVTLVHNGPALPPLPGIKTIQTTTAASMHTAVIDRMRHNKPDIYISAAAISDYAPEPYLGKIESKDAPITLILNPLPKLLTRVFEFNIPMIISFKLGESALEDARDILKNTPEIAMVIANTASNMGTATGSIKICSRSKEVTTHGSKEILARSIITEIADIHGVL
jgi:phosphopantothenoylcysteine decarboxylase/phosphopantothenate--cysteine ligase